MSGHAALQLSKRNQVQALYVERKIEDTELFVSAGPCKDISVHVAIIETGGEGASVVWMADHLIDFQYG